MVEKWGFYFRGECHFLESLGVLEKDLAKDPELEDGRAFVRNLLK